MSSSEADPAAALRPWSEDEFDEHWAAVEAYLNASGPAPAFESATRWFEGDDDVQRAAALDLLTLLARFDPTYVPSLISRAASAVNEPSEELRWSAAHALSVTDDPAVLPVLLRFLGDEDSDVRWHVATALPGLVADPENVELDDSVVEALLVLAYDESPNVRDWAVFGLGAQLDVDSPAIREAFMRSLDDTESDAAGEAAVGLARRGDDRVFEVLVTELGRPDVGNLYVEAAGEFGDPRLQPLLLALRESGWASDRADWRDELDEAIELCSAPRE